MSETLREIARRAANITWASGHASTDEIADAVAVAVLQRVRTMAINRLAFNLAKEYQQLIAEFTTGNQP